MTTLSVSIPEELKEKMSHLEEINWSAVARKAFEEKVKEVEFVKHVVSKSKLTEKDAEVISSKINESMTKKFKEMK